MATDSALPKLMKAAVVDKPGPANTLHIKEVPLPGLGHNHVIIALQYAGVGIWDASFSAAGWQTQDVWTQLKMIKGR